MEDGAIAGRPRRERKRTSKKATKFFRDISPAAIANSRNGLDETWPIGHIVRRVGHDLGGNFVTEQHLVTPGVKCIAMKDAMGTEIPHITGLRHARPFCLKARNVVVGIRENSPVPDFRTSGSGSGPSSRSASTVSKPVTSKSNSRSGVNSCSSCDVRATSSQAESSPRRLSASAKAIFALAVRCVTRMHGTTSIPRAWRPHGAHDRK